MPVACTQNDALNAAAAELLLEFSVEPNAQQLTAAVRAADSDAVGLHALLTRSRARSNDDDTHQHWISAQAQRADAPLICGSAQSEWGHLSIVSARGGSLLPISVRDRNVRGELAQGFERAELVVASGDGQLARFGVSAVLLARGVKLDRDLPLPWNVQLVATGPNGPRPVAERSVRPEAATALPEPESVVVPASPAASSGNLASLITELRRARTRPRLRDNRLLREAAAAHARLVCEQGRVAHELLPGTGPNERLAHAGLSARLLGEAIARAADANAAFEALQHSPSHLLTLLEPRFTDVGVGVASDRAGKSCYVVLLCAWPRQLVRAR
jgi:uncharacterized protein YkwD